MGIDLAKLFSDFGEACEELQKPMTLEEAIDFLDPENVSLIPENSATRIARMTKAKSIVVKYARDKLAEERKL